jgi:hypothetical protein
MRMFLKSSGYLPILAAVLAGVLAVTTGFNLDAVAAGSSSRIKGKELPVPQPAVIHIMEASGEFYEGKVGVEVHFGRAPRLQRSGELTTSGTGKVVVDAPKDDGKGRGKRDARPGGGGRKEGRETNIREERNPATQMRLTLTNRGAVPLVLEVIEFSSALGNFAVKPDKITVAPGASTETDPMFSRLGIPTEDVPVKVRLRCSGVSEQQTLVLKMPAAAREAEKKTE